jgi:hypothetical protein
MTPVLALGLPGLDEWAVIAIVGMVLFGPRLLAFARMKGYTRDLTIGCALFVAGMVFYQILEWPLDLSLWPRTLATLLFIALGVSVVFAVRQAQHRQ